MYTDNWFGVCLLEFRCLRKSVSSLLVLLDTTPALCDIPSDAKLAGSRTSRIFSKLMPTIVPDQRCRGSRVDGELVRECRSIDEPERQTRELAHDIPSLFVAMMDRGN